MQVQLENTLWPPFLSSVFRPYFSRYLCSLLFNLGFVVWFFTFSCFPPLVFLCFRPCLIPFTKIHSSLLCSFLLLLCFPVSPHLSASHSSSGVSPGLSFSTCFYLACLLSCPSSFSSIDLPSHLSPFLFSPRLSPPFSFYLTSLPHLFILPPSSALQSSPLQQLSPPLFFPPISFSRPLLVSPRWKTDTFVVKLCVKMRLSRSDSVLALVIPHSGGFHSNNQSCYNNHAAKPSDRL